MKKNLFLPIAFIFSAELYASRTFTLSEHEDVIAPAYPVCYRDCQQPTVKKDIRRYLLESPFEEAGLLSGGMSTRDSSSTDDAHFISPLSCDTEETTVTRALKHLNDGCYQEAKNLTQRAYLKEPDLSLYLLHLMSRLRIYEEDPLTTLLPHAIRVFERLPPKYHEPALSALYCHTPPRLRSELVDSWLTLGYHGNAHNKILVLQAFSNHSKDNHSKMVAIATMMKTHPNLMGHIVRSLSLIDASLWDETFSRLKTLDGEFNSYQKSDLIEALSTMDHKDWTVFNASLLKAKPYLTNRDLLDLAHLYALTPIPIVQSLSHLIAATAKASTDKILPNTLFLSELMALSNAEITLVTSFIERRLMHTNTLLQNPSSIKRLFDSLRKKTSIKGVFGQKK